jgi:hypothetical protein
MAPQRFSSLGVISSITLGVMLGCAGLLGIEDATCDPRFDLGCAEAFALEPAAGGQRSPGGGGSAMALGGAGASAVTAGAGGSASVDAAGSGGTPPDASGPAVLSLCERYCNTVAANCPAPNEQYASPGACRAVCEKLEPGNEGGLRENTVECRLARAELAGVTGEPVTYCASAGPGGAGVCGSNCEGYCTIMAKTCTLLIGSFEACLPECASVPDLSDPPDNITYDISVQAGDSVQCRLFHVSAATVDAIQHCGHASGSPPCAVLPP